MNKFSKSAHEAFQKFIEEKNIDSIDITAIFTDDTILENTAGMLSFPKIGKCKLEIRVKEGGSIPHFHIISLQNKFLTSSNLTNTSSITYRQSDADVVLTCFKE